MPAVSSKMVSAADVSLSETKQGYKMKDQEHAFWGGPQEHVEGGIRTAVKMYRQNRAAAIEKYGLMSDWDVSEVTSMEWLFCGWADFNEDLSRWGE